MYTDLHVKCPLCLSDFIETWILRREFRKILKYQVSWQSVQWEQSYSMRTDRHDGASSRFSQFCERAWKVFTRQIKDTNQSTMYTSYVATFSFWSPVHISVNVSLISAYVMYTKVCSRMRMFNVVYIIIFLWCL